MIMKHTNILVALALLSAAAVVAEPEVSGGSSMDQAMEPEVVITPRDLGQVKEYRVNGQLYMIEIVPTKGAPYYLMDSDGDGLLESRYDGTGSGLPVPRWPVLRW